MKDNLAEDSLFRNLGAPSQTNELESASLRTHGVYDWDVNR